MSHLVDTTGIDRAALLKALYDRAQPQGLGFLHNAPGPMDLEYAQRLLDDRKTELPVGSGQWSCAFDYLRGRVIKTDVLVNKIDPYLYDRDNGYGALAGVVASLRI